MRLLIWVAFLVSAPFSSILAVDSASMMSICESPRDLMFVCKKNQEMSEENLDFETQQAIEDQLLQMYPDGNVDVKIETKDETSSELESNDGHFVSLQIVNQPDKSAEQTNDQQVDVFGGDYPEAPPLQWTSNESDGRNNEGGDISGAAQDIGKQEGNGGRHEDSNDGSENHADLDAAFDGSKQGERINEVNEINEVNGGEEQNRFKEESSNTNGNFNSENTNSFDDYPELNDVNAEGNNEDVNYDELTNEELKNEKISNAEEFKEYELNNEELKNAKFNEGLKNEELNNEEINNKDRKNAEFKNPNEISQSNEDYEDIQPKGDGNEIQLEGDGWLGESTNDHLSNKQDPKVDIPNAPEDAVDENNVIHPKPLKVVVETHQQNSNNKPKQKRPAENVINIPTPFNESPLLKCSDNEDNDIEQIYKKEVISIRFEVCHFARIDFASQLFSIYENLRLLNISHIKLETLDTFANARYLKTILASHNRLTQLPSRLFPAATNLTTIDFSFNQISWISPLALVGHANLKYLNLSWNELTIVEESLLSSLQHLEILDLSHNQFTVFHSNVFRPLANLKLLSLSHNPISQIGGNLFSSMKNLINLNLSNLKVNRLETSIVSHQKQLQSFNVANNNLKRIDFQEVSKFLPQLMAFYVEGNQLIDLKGFSQAQFPNLTIFGINYNDFNCSYLQEFVTSVNTTSLTFSEEWFLDEGTSIKGVLCKETIVHEDEEFLIRSSVPMQERDGGMPIRFMLVLLSIAMIIVIGCIVMIRHQVNKATGRIAFYEFNQDVDAKI